MSRHDPIQSLKDMRDHAAEALQFLEGKSRTELEADRMLSLAIVRLLEIVGEAARRVPVERREPNGPTSLGSTSWRFEIVCPTPMI